jgi:molybdopterin/thiamine biosynthesis adenylyltransferase
MIDPKAFGRLEKRFDVGVLGESRVLIIGCGSGGGSVALQLVMSGIQQVVLVDRDVLEIENVIRHVCGLRFVGRKKVDALEEVLLDRNPGISVEKFEVDVMHFDQLDAEVKKAGVVVLATDNEPSRYLVNEMCVRNQRPFVAARVFTRGIGGEVFAYRPDMGCLACLEGVLERSQFRQGVREIDLVSEEERQKMYGMEIEEIKDSPGLNVDISFITAFHTRFALDAIARLLPDPPRYFVPIQENYVVWGNRPTAPFSKNFELQRITLHRWEGCKVCSGQRSARK